MDIKIKEEEKTAQAKVAEDQLSLAIGKSGQNVRLAAKLTGWKIDIISDTNKKVEEASAETETVDEDKKNEEPETKPEIKEPEEQPESEEKTEPESDHKATKKPKKSTKKKDKK